MASPEKTNPSTDVTALLGDADLPLGQVIPGSRYRVIGRIGRGGMGAVYEAEHVDLQKRVAVKVLLSKSARDTRRVAAFLREARTASRISSPYIADVTDFGELADGRVYFVMAFVEGQSLGHRIRSGEVFPPERVIPIVRQIAKGLAHTHEKGVVHLDVKPDNIMLVDGGARPDTVRMVDFGIAGLLEDARPGAKTISGTPEYVSPERIGARAFDQRSDIYSLGVVTYELLCGVVPFRGADAVATLKLHIEGKPPPMAVAAPGRKIPARLEKVVNELIAKEPDDRPANMAAVEALLCEAQIAAALTTRWDDLELPAVDDAWRLSLSERMPSPGGRKRRTIAIGASAAALVAGAIAIYLGVIREPRVVVKEVRVEVTGTNEIPSVAAWIVRANQAVRRQDYVTPLGESALDYLERAEVTAKESGRRSPGAQYLRENAAAALLAMGREMEQVDLFDLALVKYREALRFLPEDPELIGKAQFGADELAVFMNRSEWEKRRAATTGGRERETARQMAADLFAAAKRGSVSQARRAIERLATVDRDGAEQARLSDGLRKIAARSWGAGKTDEARSLYRVIASLDPRDLVAARRAEEESAPGDDDGAPAPPPAAERVARRPAVPAAVPRDTAAALVSVKEGEQAIRAVRLADAEKAFSRAIKADPLNGEAFAGLAAVAFERARYEEALNFARQATQLGKTAGAHKILGDCYFKMFRYAEARSAYQTALKLAPTRGDIKNRLAEVEAKLSI